MKRVLIIDDEPQVRSTYQALLAKEGFNVLTASSAVEAYSMLTNGEMINMFLLDRIENVLST